MLPSFLIYMLFGVLGYLVSIKLNIHQKKGTLILTILACLLSGFVGVNSGFTFFDYSIYINNILLATSFGILVHLVIRRLMKDNTKYLN